MSLLTPADPAGDPFRAVGQIIVQLSAVEHALRPFLSKLFPQDAAVAAASQTSTLEGRIKAAISMTEFAAVGDPKLSEFVEIFSEGLRLERLRGMIVHGHYVFDAATARGGPTVVESVDGGTAEIVLTTELFASEARKIGELLIRLERADALTFQLPSDGLPPPDA